MTVIKALVTGGNGFVGRALVETLLAQGADRVRVLDRSPPCSALPSSIDYIQASILDEKSLRGAVSGCTHVFHLAAIPDLWLPDKRDFHKVNTLGTRKVLQACARADIRRVVYTSTESIIIGVNGRREDNRDESVTPTLAQMPGPYCRSKFLAEREARRAAAEGLPVVIVNPTLPVGPGDERRTPPTLMLLGFLNGDFKAYLETVFNIIHVRDVALGHLLAAQHGRVGERYILGGENLLASELLAKLQEMTGLSLPRFRVPYPLALVFALLSETMADRVTGSTPAAPLTGVRLARQCMSFSNEKARKELGLNPVPAAQALNEAVQWFRDQGLLKRPLPRALGSPADG